MSALALAVRRAILERFPGDKWFELNAPEHSERAAHAGLPVIYHRNMSAGEWGLSSIEGLGLAWPVPGMEVLWQLADEAAFSETQLGTVSMIAMTQSLIMFRDVFGVPEQTWEPFDVPEGLEAAFEEIRPLGILEESGSQLVWNDDAPKLFYSYGRKS